MVRTQPQTSPIKTTRVVGLNIPWQSRLKDFETSKTPILLKNLKLRNNNIIFNQQSSPHAAANSDAPFDYIQQEKPENRCSNALSQLADVSVSDIKTLKSSLNAIITVGKEDLKQVTLTKTQKSAYVKILHFRKFFWINYGIHLGSFDRSAEERRGLLFH